MYQIFFFGSLRHICTHEEEFSASLSYIVCEDVGGGDL